MKKYNTIFFLFLLLTFGCKKNAPKEAVVIGKETVKLLEPSPENQRNSEGDFIKLKDGKILFIYTKFTSGPSDDSPSFLASRISSDKGKTWTDKDEVVLENEGDLNTMSVSLLRLNDGRIALFYLRKNSNSNCVPYVRFSTDETKTWSDPIRCIDTDGYYVLNNNRVLQLKSGRILLAVHAMNEPTSTDKGVIRSYFSDDNGLSWNKSEAVPNEKDITLQEPGLVALKNGKLLLFCRTDMGVQYFSYSANNGESWSPIEPGNIKSPLSPASITRIPSTGDLLLLWNNNFKKSKNGGKRTPFNMAISKDEGRTWSKSKTIASDPNGWYCYTAVEFIDDYVLLGHCAGKTRVQSGLATTQITRLHLNWVYDDAIASPTVNSDNKERVSLFCDEKEVKIYYTLDGSNPNTSTTLYTEPFSIAKTTLLRMQAYKEGKPSSVLVSKFIGTNILQEAVTVNGSTFPGLAYNYYETFVSGTASLKKLKAARSGVSPSVTIESAEKMEDFAFTFKGYIKIPKDGRYTFYLSSNDGSTLKMDGYLLIDNDGRHGDFEKSAPISLSKGLHTVKVAYFQNGGGKRLKLLWASKDIQKAEVPETAFFHTED